MTTDLPVSRTAATDREVEARCAEEHCGPMCDQVMAERDHYCDVADQLASLLAPPEVLGEHSSMNDPWQNAINHAEAQHAKAARAAAAPDSKRMRIDHPGGLRAGDVIVRVEWANDYEWDYVIDRPAALLAEQPGGEK